MQTTLPLKKMSIEEKIRAMEEIWEDLCQNPDKLSSPSWHEEILLDREERIKNGDDKFSDWEYAKKSIRDTVS
jgi:hypothetical protein